MRLLETPDDTDFRHSAREWLDANVPREKRPHDGWEQREFDLTWQKRQYEAGWAGISWPTEYGGKGLPLVRQAIWHEEYARAGAPQIGAMFIGLSHAGPTLIVKGSEEHKQRYLPAILKGEEVWCQGFSEPGAGSDLASLTTSGRIEDDHLVVNGSKIWTTYGPVADLQELLIRTSSEKPRHKGLSWVICDLRSEGVSIRPIKAMSGYTHFCQIHYDDVRIPIENVVGDIDGGWSVAMATLGFERGTGTIGHQMELSRWMDQLVRMARELPGPCGEERAIDNGEVAGQLARLKADVAALQAMTSMAIARNMRQEVPGAEGNLVALQFGELVRRVHGFAFELAGNEAFERDGPWGDWPYEYLDGFKWGIGGGTLEIRRNTIGERLLGLPKGRS